MTDRRRFGHYVIGVFDILGQSRKLLQPIEFLPKGKDELRRLAENTTEAAAAVRRFRQLFQTQFDSFATSDAARRGAAGLPAVQRAQLTEDLASKIASSQFSDTYVAAVSLSRSSTAGAMADVYRSLLASAVVWLTSLATGYPIRGGVEIGTALEIGANEVYGEGLVKAYRLESRVAQWPRIVVGERLVDVLRHTQGLRESPDALRAANVATECCSVLRRDPDDRTIVDVLGPVMAQFFGRSDLRDAFSRAHEHVRNELHTHTDAGDGKLVSRYRTLLTYFDEQAPIWPQQ